MGSSKVAGGNAGGLFVSVGLTLKDLAEGALVPTFGLTSGEPEAYTY